MSQKLSIVSQSFFWAIWGVVFIGLLVLFSHILLPFVVATIIAYLLNPVVRILGVKGLRRWVASLLILGLFFLVVIILIAIAAPPIVRELNDFITNIPQYTQHLTTLVQSRLNLLEQKTGVDLMGKLHDSIQDDIGKTLQMGHNVIGGVASGLLLGGSAVIGFVTTALLIPIAAYFMMKDWPRIVGFVHNMIPKAHKATINSILDQIDRKLAGFIRGQMSVCAILGIMYSIALSIAGLKYGALIGIGTGILSVIPYVGSTLGLLTSVGVAGLQSGGDLSYVGIIAAIFFTGQFIEGNFIAPKLIGDSVGLHPLWIIFALLAGGSLLGLLGMLIAVPTAAIVSVLLGFAINKYKNSDFYKTPEEKPAQTVIITEVE